MRLPEKRRTDIPKLSAALAVNIIALTADENKDRLTEISFWDLLSDSDKGKSRQNTI